MLFYLLPINDAISSPSLLPETEEEIAFSLDNETSNSTIPFGKLCTILSDLVNV